MLHDAVKSSHQLWQVKKRPDAPSTRSLQKVREKKTHKQVTNGLCFTLIGRESGFPIFSLDIRLLVLIKT